MLTSGLCTLTEAKCGMWISWQTASPVNARTQHQSVFVQHWLQRLFYLTGAVHGRRLALYWALDSYAVTVCACWAKNVYSLAQKRRFTTLMQRQPARLYNAMNSAGKIYQALQPMVFKRWLALNQHAGWRCTGVDRRRHRINTSIFFICSISLKDVKYKT